MLPKMISNEDIDKLESENGANVDEKKTSIVQEIIDLDGSDDSDIEIVQISGNVGRRNKFKKLRNRGKTKVYVNSVNCLTKNEQESVIKEEIIISDASDYSDDNDLKTPTKRTANLNCNSKGLIKVASRKPQKPNKNLSSIILNCPRCNKTETVFSTTIKCVCKDCNVNMFYVCNKCNYRYESLPALYRHKKLQCQSVLLGGKTMSPLKLFFRKCSKCKTVQREWRTKEARSCSKCKIDMLYECTVCSTTYTSYSGLYTHSRRQCQPSKRTYYCNDCDYKCKSPHLLTAHLIRSHVQLYPRIVNCAKCGKNFKNLSKLKLHETSCGIPYYKCKFCSYKPKYQSNLRKHLVTYHKDLVQAEEDVENIIVEVANAKKQLKDNDLTALNVDKEEKDELQMLKQTFCYKCNESKPFIPGRYCCPTCKSKFGFKCTRCRKIFSTPPSLYRHIRRQHGKLTYCCKQCGRTFSFFGDANEHRKICGQAPRFSCEICSFQTRYKYNLHCHMESLHNENRKSFTCKDCGVTYKTEKSIKKHLKMGCEQAIKATENNLIANCDFVEKEEVELSKAQLVLEGKFLLQRETDLNSM